MLKLATVHQIHVGSAGGLGDRSDLSVVMGRWHGTLRRWTVRVRDEPDIGTGNPLIVPFGIAVDAVGNAYVAG